ncbi:hypothetical protein [Amycolatopsis nigrescens]|uniref:hypothetical protein n=1 Tax=Amycolatopsis nigrescens TaxID=381445 RepID=UPI000367447E|nr:hypothetical protein [Amycolatopsis nigrescens]
MKNPIGGELPGFDKNGEPGKKLVECLRKLHKDRGLRHDDLRSRLGPELRELWGITEKDDKERVRAKAAIRIRARLAGFDRKMTEVVAAYYNLSPDAKRNAMLLGERREELARRKGDQYSVRQTSREFDWFLAELVKSLKQPCPPIPEAELQRMVDQLRGGAAQDRLGRAIHRVHHPQHASDEALVQLRSAVLHGPRSATDELAVTSTAGFGHWLCVFTSPGLLHDYRRRTGAAWLDEHWSKTGAELVREVHRVRLPVGILVNPSPRRGDETAESLPIPPELVARLAQSHRPETPIGNQP